MLEILGPSFEIRFTIRLQNCGIPISSKHIENDIIFKVFVLKVPNLEDPVCVAIYELGFHWYGRGRARGWIK